MLIVGVLVDSSNARARPAAKTGGRLHEVCPLLHATLGIKETHIAQIAHARGSELRPPRAHGDPHTVRSNSRTTTA